MHHIFHTEGIILGSRNYGEAGKCYYIFTRDHGMIFASATGVRKIASKLRFVLQDFSYVKLDLVRGRDFWRITSCSKTNELEEIKDKPLNLKIFVQVVKLLQRLLAGEETNEILFIDFLKGLKILEKVEKKEDLANVEIFLIFNILQNLGYIGAMNVNKDMLSSPLGDEFLYEIVKNKSNILREINRALKESHL